MFSIFRRNKPAEPAPLGPEADAFLAAAAEEFNEKQAALAANWGFGEYTQWGFDQDSGIFTLTLANGSRVLADGQILGSHSPRDGSWEWAWNNPNVEAGVARASRAVKALGERLGIPYLVSGRIPVDGDPFVSYLCAIGAKATESEGAFRGSAGAINVHLLLFNPRRVDHNHANKMGNA